MSRGYARRGPIYPEAVGTGHLGIKRTALAAGVTALAVGLGASPASAAAVAESHQHAFTTTAGARVTCYVWVQQNWLEDEGLVRTSLDGPAACRAAAVAVRWHFVDASAAAHDGKEVVTGGQEVSVDLHGVAADLASRHRVTLADCAADCTFGPYGFAPFASSK
jgi:hypothetical protein